MLEAWRTSLKGKLVAVTLGITLGVLVLSAVSLFVAELVALGGQKASNSQILARTIASNLSAAVAFKDNHSAEEILAALRAAPTVLSARLLLSTGVELAHFYREDGGEMISHSGEIQLPTSEESRQWFIDRLQFTAPIVLDGELIGSITIQSSLADIRARLLTFALVMAITILVASALAYFLASKLQSVITGPILELAAAAQQVTTEKSYSARVTQRSKDEVGHLVKSFNEMLTQIQTRDQQLSEARSDLEVKVQQRTAELRSEMLVRKQAQEALQREQEQLRTLIKHAPVAIAMLDTNLNYLAHSDQWTKDFRLSETSVISRNHLQTISNLPAHWREAYQGVLSGKPVTMPEDELLLLSGQKLHLRWTAQPWYRPNGDLGGVLKVAVVIDELVEAREAAIRSAKLRTEFLTNVSHELRTPLNAIVGFSRLLMETTTSEVERTEYIGIINHSAHLLTSLINDVLDFSKMESKKIKFEKIDFEPERLLSHCVDLFRGNAKVKGIGLRLEIPDPLPKILVGDPTRIQQILVNLLGNAIKFTHQGEVCLTCQIKDQRPDQCSLMFHVSDTGIGIPAEKLKDVFEAFTQADGTITRQYGGTGLGLTIVRGLVIGMNGDVKVVSTPNVGSTFTVTLPLDIRAARSTTGTGPISQDGSNAVSSTPLRILVAEDNRVNQKLVETILKRGGHSVEVVNNGKEAVAALEQGSFDLILMDLQMPEMGGVEACRVIRSKEAANPNHGRLPIIALTAHAFAEDRARCDEAGMDGYLTKPIDIKQLFVTLSNLSSKSLTKKVD